MFRLTTQANSDLLEAFGIEVCPDCSAPVSAIGIVIPCWVQRKFNSCWRHVYRESAPSALAGDMGMIFGIVGVLLWVPAVYGDYRRAIWHSTHPSFQECWRNLFVKPPESPNVADAGLPLAAF